MLAITVQKKILQIYTFYLKKDKKVENFCKKTLEFLLVSAIRQRDGTSALMSPFRGVHAPGFGASDTRTEV